MMKRLGFLRVIIGAAAIHAALYAGSAGAAEVRLEAPDTPLLSGETVTATLRIDSASPVGAYSCRLVYPGDLLSVTAVLPGADDLFGAPQSINFAPSGLLHFNDIQAATLAGPAGTLRPASLRWRAREDVSYAAVEISLLLLDTSGQALDVTAETWTLGTPPPTPTPTPTATPTPTVTPTPTATPPLPEIHTYAPRQVVAGMPFAMTGTHLGPMPGRVEFHRNDQILSATPDVWSETHITCTLPLDICDDAYPVVIHAEDGRSGMADEPLDVLSPIIDDFPLGALYVGETSTIHGRNFGPAPGQYGRIYFTSPQAAAEIVSWSSQTITYVVPGNGWTQLPQTEFLKILVGCNTFMVPLANSIRRRVPQEIDLTVDPDTLAFGDIVLADVELSAPLAGGTYLDVFVRQQGLAQTSTLRYPWFEGASTFTLGPAYLRNAGVWDVWVRSPNQNDIEAATSDVASVTVTTAPVKLDLQAYELTLSGDVPTLTGKISPVNSTVSIHPSDHFQGLPIELTLTSPSGQVKSDETLTSDPSGNYSYQGDELTVTEKGTWKARAAFAGNNRLGAVTSSTETFEVSGTAGYALIVCGNDAGLTGLQNHMNTVNLVYQSLRTRQFPEDQIRILTVAPDLADNPAAVLGPPSEVAIAQALDDIAVEAALVPGPLVLVLIDHGTPDAFHIAQTTRVLPKGLKGLTPEDFPDEDVLSADELAALLNNYTAQLTAPENRDTPVIVVIGACSAGTFLDDLRPLPSDTHPRIVISSCDTEELSYSGQCFGFDTDLDCQGELFTARLFMEVRRGLNLRAAFENAATFVRVATHAGRVGPINGGTRDYHDQAVQHPLLDDDGDGIGTNSGFSAGDGEIADDIVLGVNTNPVTLGILAHSSDQALAPGQIPEITALINQFDGLMWAEVRRPDDAPRPYDPTVTLQPPVPGRRVQGKEVEPGLFRWNETEYAGAYVGFSATGTYEIRLYASTGKDASGNLNIATSFPILVHVGADNILPATFSLLQPTDGFVISQSKVFMEWEPSSLPDQEVLYQVIVAKDEQFSEQVYKQSYIRDTYVFLESDILDSGETYYWTVYASGQNSGRRRAQQVFSFTYRDSNYTPVVHQGRVLDAITGAEIPSPTLTITRGVPDIGQMMEHSFVLVGVHGETFDFTLSADGYCDLNKHDFRLRHDEDGFIVDYHLCPRDVLTRPDFLKYMKGRHEHRLSGRELLNLHRCWQEACPPAP